MNPRPDARIQNSNDALKVFNPVALCQKWVGFPLEDLITIISSTCLSLSCTKYFLTSLSHNAYKNQYGVKPRYELHNQIIKKGVSESERLDTLWI